MTTADWNGTEPIAKSTTHVGATGVMWASRRVRSDGTVRFRGHTWRPEKDVIVRPTPGEWLLFCDYGPDHPPTAYEWTAPADPDGFIRRMFWEEKA